MHPFKKWRIESPTFVLNVLNAEDLARIPGTDWVVTSSMPSVSREVGCLYLINILDRSRIELGREIFSSRAGLEKGLLHEPPSQFSPHGISVRAGENGVHALYVVNHGGRESIELFEIDATGLKPRIRWRGCIIMPPRSWANDLVPIPGGGLLVTNMFDPGDSDTKIKMVNGQNTGHVLEWQDDSGWREIPGSELSGPNGIEVSKDGRWIYVASWPSKSLVRMSRDGKTKPATIKTGHLTDNLTWDSEGWILAAGPDTTPQDFFQKYDSEDLVSFPFTVVRIHPDTLASHEVIRYGSDQFGTGTVAVEVGDEIWVGSSRADRIACFPFRRA